MSEDSQRPIIIKRVKKHARGHHAGAWKIAYADFVTAMMAFFLLMWLVGSTTSGDLKGIAEYFQTPLKVALMGGSGSGDSSSLVKGGGQDLTRSMGQVMKGTIEAEKKTINLKAAEAELARKEAAKLQDLKERIEQAIESNAALKPFREQMLLDITTEGLRIQIVDEYNRPMFASGSAQLQSYSRDILREIGKALNDMPNRISISGHTDALAYSGGAKGYSNWELSADRANTARRELIGGGLAETRMKILCLEQGDWIKPTDFPTNGPDWEARRYADFDISPNRRARPRREPPAPRRPRPGRGRAGGPLAQGSSPARPPGPRPAGPPRPPPGGIGSGRRVSTCDGSSARIGGNQDKGDRSGSRRNYSRRRRGRPPGSGEGSDKIEGNRSDPCGSHSAGLAGAPAFGWRAGF